MSGPGDHRPEKVVPNDSAGWLGRDPTLDEQEVLVWLERQKVPDRGLHVGVGASLFFKRFGKRIALGLTKDGGEAESARTLGLDTVLCNKYDVNSYNHILGDPFDCIIDVNIRSYACCDHHFREYMQLMLSILRPSGYLLTSTRGLGYLNPTSLPELRQLLPDWSIRNEGTVVVMRPGIRSRALAAWSALRQR